MGIAPAGSRRRSSLISPFPDNVPVSDSQLAQASAADSEEVNTNSRLATPFRFNIRSYRHQKFPQQTGAISIRPTNRKRAGIMGKLQCYTAAYLDYTQVHPWPSGISMSPLPQAPLDGRILSRTFPWTIRIPICRYLKYPTLRPPEL